MRDILQIIRDNGNDNTPAMDTHNLTGRAIPEGVEWDWAPYEVDEVFVGEEVPYEVFLSNSDWAQNMDEAYDLGYLGDECG